MKRTMICLVCITAICLFAACDNADQISVNELPVRTVAVNEYGSSIDDLATLEEHCTEIVRGYLKNDPKEISNKTKSITVTVSTLVITEVYKGNLKVGNKVKLGEDYCIGEVNGEKVVDATEGYAPSTVGIEYIWFIGQHLVEGSPWYGVYVPVMCTKGRYRVVDPATYKESQEIMDKPDLGYWGIRSDVISKYME